MKNTKYNGYIEGYYGKLLTWNDRFRIINRLKENKMNYYFYAPKEDINHRLNWRNKYDHEWLKNFKKFCNQAKLSGINIIVGISPGLDFDFLNFHQCLFSKKPCTDFLILFNKINSLLKNGAYEIALLFDDLPNDFNKKFKNIVSEGFIHAALTNQISEKLNKNIFVVPRIYADQLIVDGKDYLEDFGKKVNKEIIIFYCGKNIVSKEINKITLFKISKLVSNKIIIWDNFYSNDYCPRRLFLGPLIGRNEVQNIMINPTGLIETDLLIIDIFKATKNSMHTKIKWLAVLKKNKIPENFIYISNFFLKPDFGEKPSLNNFKINDKTLEVLDYFLWKWKNPLSREWYPFLLGLKQDLQLYKSELSSERIIKTQTIPLARFSLKS